MTGIKKDNVQGRTGKIILSAVKLNIKESLDIILAVGY